MQTTKSKSIAPRSRMDLSLSDPVFDDMGMSEHDMADREQFRSVCFATYEEQSFPEGGPEEDSSDCDEWTRIVFKDWKVLLSILLQIGYWDIRDKDAARDFFPIPTSLLSFGLGNLQKEGSQIERLTVKGTRSLTRSLPKGIHRLDRLETLEIRGENLTSLPLQELNSIPKLFRLKLTQASKLLSDSLCGLPETETQTLTSVTSLTLSGDHSLQLLRVCPSVEVIRLEFKNSENLDAILTVLGSASVKMDKLQSIRFPGPNINGEQMAKLLLEILPRFPNLETLHLDSWSGGVDFRVLSDRLLNGKCKSLAISKSLRTLLVRVGKSTQPALKADMMTLLKFFPTIDRIEFQYNPPKEHNLDTDPDFRYALVQNMVGRRILEPGGGGGSRLPLSAWPIVLKRAQFQDRPWPFLRRFGLSSSESAEILVATGIYYLLREGSALMDRRDGVVVDGGGRSSSSPPRSSKRKKRA